MPINQHVLSAMGVAVIAVGGVVLADHALGKELEVIRGTRVALDARRALEQRSRPPGVEGELTIVQDQAWVVNTSSATRAGTPLEARDAARLERHKSALEKKSIREPLPNGMWRATVSDGTYSSELLSDPPAVPRHAPWLAAGIALVVGLSIVLGGRRTVTDFAGPIAAGAIVLFAVYAGLTDVATGATAYLAQSTSNAPAINLQALKILAWPLGASFAVIAALFTIAREK